MLKILNLGAGVQSSTILLMACRGELPRPDACIFADTREEPRSVYDWMDSVLKPAALAAGIPIHVVSEGGRPAHRRKVDQIPGFVRGSDGKYAMVPRQCTRDWKIIPIERKVRELLGLKPGAHYPKGLAVETWLGISGDEIQRMKASTDPWRRYWHPLVEMPWSEGKAPAWRNPPLRRNDCQAWLKANGYAEAPRSACSFCPMHSDKEWRRLQTQEPEAFAAAVAADTMLRQGDRRHDAMFVHRSLRPLSEIDFTRQQELALDTFDEECGGVCGV